MSLLQDPIKAVAQIRWYLDNRDKELFPGAFLLAAGSLARQLLEQILFILAFYSGMPNRQFMKNLRELRGARRILLALQKQHPQKGKRYIELARQRGSRVRKFARYPRSLERWRRLLNEPAHFVNPGAVRKTGEAALREFVNRVGDLFEQPDGFLITAAVNEIRSTGSIKASLGPEPENVPGVVCRNVVTPSNLFWKSGRLGLEGSAVEVQVVSDTQDVPYRWKKRVVVVQHSYGMSIGMEMVTRSGRAVDISSFQKVLESFASDPRDRRLLIKRLKQVGYDVTLRKEPKSGKLYIQALPKNA